MQETELRIGNIVWEDYGGYKIITAINSNSKGDFPNSVSARALNMSVSGQYGLDEIKPIRLTPEILEKCGFEKKGRYAIGAGGYQVFVNGRIELLQPQKGDPYTLAFYEAKITYIHQLQNIYWCLTGKELIISL